MNKQQLANKIWESANKMRSKIEANEYKDYILGFIFYKYLSDQELSFLKKNDYTDEYLPTVTEDDQETVKWVQTSLGFFISYENLFSTWLNMGKDFDVANVRDALSAFNRLINPSHEKVFVGIFDTLQTGLSKLGGTSGEQTKAIRDLIYLIKDIPMDGRQDYDTLGFIYEYLISMFASNAGKKAGEFYTPHEVSLLMSEIVAHHLRDRKEIKIYDPTSGSGSLLINIGKSVSKHTGDDNNIIYYAQELKANTYNLTRMNLVMRGILADNIKTRNGDTLEEDWPYFDDSDPVGTYEPLYVDAVVSNPPYSQNWDPANKESDPRYSRFGLAPKSKADYAFLLHDLFHIKPDGIMTIVLPHGVLFRGGEEGEIRKNLIEQNHIDAIIGLPANIFFGTGIPTIIMVLRQKRENTDVLIVDASKGFEKVGKNNKLRSSDIRRIADAVTERRDIPKYSRKVSRDEIRQNDYNLNIPRYVDSSETAESWDIYASMFGGIPNSELDNLSEFWRAFPSLRSLLFKAVSSEYSETAVDDVKTAIKTSADVTAFRNNYENAFADITAFLESRLLNNMENMVISKEESVLSADIFNRLIGIPLIDPYEAFQLLDDEWNKISVDLEMIQTEGFEAVRKVDPNMILKKKDGKDIEVQDGYIGHVIPFELVQSVYLSDETSTLHEKENRLTEIASDYEELLDSLDEETKNGDFVNDDKTAFVAAEVKKALKAKELEAEILDVLKKYDKLNTEEKALKTAIKKESAALHMKAKETIENLTDDQARGLLKNKWIDNLTEQIAGLPDKLVNALAAKVLALSEKYAVTFASVEDEISQTEKELSAMIDDLTGSDFDMQGLKELQALLGGV